MPPSKPVVALAAKVSRLSSVSTVNRAASVGLFVVRLLGSSTLHAQAPAAAVPTTAFVDVSVIPMDRERVLAHQTVLVQGARIVALGRADRVRCRRRRLASRPATSS